MTKRYDDLPKALKREIRELAGVVHERLLAAELRKLDGEFARWRTGEMDAFELSALVHKFHEGPPREFWIAFNTNQIPALLHRVAEGRDEGILPEAEISEDLLAFLQVIPKH